MKKAVTLANCVLAGMTALCLPAALTVHANCLFLDPVPCSKQAGHPNMEGIVFPFGNGLSGNVKQLRQRVL